MGRSEGGTRGIESREDGADAGTTVDRSCSVVVVVVAVVVVVVAAG